MQWSEDSKRRGDVHDSMRISLKVRRGVAHAGASLTTTSLLLISDGLGGACMQLLQAHGQTRS